MTDNNDQDNDFLNGQIPDEGELYDFDDPFMSDDVFDQPLDPSLSPNEELIPEDHLVDESQPYRQSTDVGGYNPLFGNEVFTLDTEQHALHADEIPDNKPENLSEQQPNNTRLINKLQLDLKVVAGTLTFTTKDLEQLTVGNILTVSGVTPGHAWLEFEGKVLAQGELVNIDGQLGLQINRLEE